MRGPRDVALCTLVRHLILVALRQSESRVLILTILVEDVLRFNLPFLAVNRADVLALVARFLDRCWYGRSFVVFIIVEEHEQPRHRQATI